MIVFRLPGGFPVYAYSLLLAVGTFIGLAGVALRARREEALPLVEAGMWALLGGLIGGRAAYVWLYWPAFQSQRLQALQVQLGGLSWPGALAGALLALALVALLTRQSLGRLADALLPLLTAVCVTAWLGCIIEGCAYGPPVRWGGLVVPDEWGVMLERWPVQLFGALAILIMFWVTDRVPRRAAAVPGLRACLMLLGLAVVQLGAVALAQPGRFWLGLPADAWAAMLLAVLALGGMGLAIQIVKRKETDRREIE
jgi:prolipoprotein diacylglyceryltransferase